MINCTMPIKLKEYKSIEDLKAAVPAMDDSELNERYVNVDMGVKNANTFLQSQNQVLQMFYDEKAKRQIAFEAADKKSTKTKQTPNRKERRAIEKKLKKTNKKEKQNNG